MVSILIVFSLFLTTGLVSDSHNSFGYADNGKITFDGTTYFGDDKTVSDINEPLRSPNRCSFEQEFEQFVNPNSNTQNISEGLKTCSQIGIMQPLEQLHSANLALGIRLERFFERIFCSWGKFVASNPWSFILGSIIVSLYLAAGVFTNFQVTTDPVDLWVPAGSQARSDMEYFNNKFWKFYRIEQLIIEPVYPKSFVIENIISKQDDKEINFGPVFNQTFLLEVYDLYTNLLKLSARHVDSNGIVSNVTLRDICHKPLNGECAPQSIFTYFHDDISKLQGPHYLDIIQECIE